MSVVITIPPTIRPFRGYEEAALPDGYWAAHASVLGDGSAGLASINVRFSTVTEPNASTLWNLEQLLVSVTSSVVSFRLDYGLMDQFPVGISTGVLTKLIQGELEDFGTVAGGRALNFKSLALPLFLGAGRKDTNSDLSIDVDNVNATSLTVFAQGFFWGPGAINAPGGPQRPATSLYGR